MKSRRDEARSSPLVRAGTARHVQRRRAARAVARRGVAARVQQQLYDVREAADGREVQRRAAAALADVRAGRRL